MESSVDLKNENWTENQLELEDNEKITLRCFDCKLDFTNKYSLYSHVYYHIKQPIVVLQRIQLPPIKLTIKNQSEVVNSPLSSPTLTNCKKNCNKLEEQNCELKSSKNDVPFNEIVDTKQHDLNIKSDEIWIKEDTMQEQTGNVDSVQQDDIVIDGEKSDTETKEDNENCFNGNETENEKAFKVISSPATSFTESPTPEKDDETENQEGTDLGQNIDEVDSVSDFPKIRIKSGLMKTAEKAAEKNDDFDNQSNKNHNSWTNLDSSNTNENSTILSLLNNDERAKDLGFNTTDTEFISVDRLNDTNKQTELYNSNNNNNSNASNHQNSLNPLANLPMEALTQQVSMLQPPGNGLHQQNVLINIQQFQQQPPPPPPPARYQPPSLYHHPPQSLYQPYQYAPSNPVYYPPAPPAYTSQHMGASRPQAPMPQPSQPSMHASAVFNSSLHARQAAPPPPRQLAVGPKRMPMNQGTPRQQTLPPRHPMPRPRIGLNPGVRAIRPKPANSGPFRVVQQHGVKRTGDQGQAAQVKKRPFDMLTPDKDDDDCQVICTQPKNTDGGLPQIQSVQGGTSETEGNVMHLTDAITLSIRNPVTKPSSPKRSDAKIVANILATRGITVTATPKSVKEKTDPKNSVNVASSLNLNGAVSIIPSIKSNKTINGQKQTDSHLLTVDLTDDNALINDKTIKTTNSPQQSLQQQNVPLPFRCDLCSAQYPNPAALSKHRQTYHRTGGGMCEIGIPLVNLKQPGIFQRMSSLGIFNYIPLQPPNADGKFGIPLINMRNPGNIGALGSTTMLTLGPTRTIPKPNGLNNSGKQNFKN